MREAGVRARHKRRYKATTDSKHSMPVADNVLARNFTPEVRRKPDAGVLFHSDRGSQYASHAMRDMLVEYGMTAPMSRKGNCWDNAPTESFFNSLKNERVHAARYKTRAQAEADLFKYIAVFYNRRRCHSTLGYRSPMQFLED